MLQGEEEASTLRRRPQCGAIWLDCGAFEVCGWFGSHSISPSVFGLRWNCLSDWLTRKCCSVIHFMEQFQGSYTIVYLLWWRWWWGFQNVLKCAHMGHQPLAAQGRVRQQRIRLTGSVPTNSAGISRDRGHVKFEGLDTLQWNEPILICKWLWTNVTTHFRVNINDSALVNEGERAVTLDWGRLRGCYVLRANPDILALAGACQVLLNVCEAQLEQSLQSTEWRGFGTVYMKSDIFLKKNKKHWNCYSKTTEK